MSLIWLNSTEKVDNSNLASLANILMLQKSLSWKVMFFALMSWNETNAKLEVGEAVVELHVLIWENTMFSRFNWVSCEAIICSILDMLSKCKLLSMASLQEIKENNGIAENLSLDLLPSDCSWKIKESAYVMLIVKLENTCSARRSISRKETSIY